MALSFKITFDNMLLFQLVNGDIFLTFPSFHKSFVLGAHWKRLCEMLRQPMSTMYVFVGGIRQLDILDYPGT